MSASACWWDWPWASPTPVRYYSYGYVPERVIVVRPRARRLVRITELPTRAPLLAPYGSVYARDYYDYLEAHYGGGVD